MKAILILSLFLNLGYTSCTKQGKVVEAKSYDRKCSVFRSIPPTDKSKKEIIFLGHSLINEFLIDEYMPHGDSIVFVNMGIGGDEAKGCYNRRELAFDRKPSLVVIELGINDFINSEPLDTTIYYYGGILDDAKRRGINILVCSVIPGDSSFFENIEELNIFLKEKSKKNGFRYLDLFTPMSKEGSLAPKYNCGDYIHLTGAGYTLWADSLKKYIYD